MNTASQMNIATRKIQLLIDEENSTLPLTEIYQYFRELNQKVAAASNRLISQYFTLYQEVSGYPLNKLERMGLVNPKTSKPFYGTLLLNKYMKAAEIKPYQLTLQHFNEPGISYVTTSLATLIYKKFTNDLFDILKGTASLPNFKQDAPLPINITGHNKNKLSLDGFAFSKEITFKMYYGRDRSNNRIIVERIVKGEDGYKLCDSQIQFKDGKFFLYLVFKSPIKKMTLNNDVAVGIDLGLNVSAVVATADSKCHEFIPMQGTIDKFRNNIQRRRRCLARELKYIEGGKGRSHKLNALYRIREKEHNAVRTINHYISKAVVEFAVRVGAGVLKLEHLKGFDPRTKYLKNWTYSQLQQMIEYKAKKCGITVLYIDPYHTSQACSHCGHWELGQRNGTFFECKSCGYKQHADLNAAINIAISNNLAEAIDKEVL